MFCGYCGNKVNLNKHRFCTSCGKFLENHETSVLENEDTEEKYLTFPDLAQPEIAFSKDEVILLKEEPKEEPKEELKEELKEQLKEENLSSYKILPSEVLPETYESIHSEIKLEDESIYSAFNELDTIQTEPPIEKGIHESEYLCVYWTVDKEFPWKALTLDNKFMLGHYSSEEDAASAAAEYHKVDRGTLKVASKWKGKREEFRHSLIGKIYGPESDEFKEVVIEIARHKEERIIEITSKESLAENQVSGVNLLYEAGNLSGKKIEEPFWIAYLLSSTTFLSFWVLVIMKGEFDKRLLETSSFWEPHFLLLMAVLYHKTKINIFGVLVFGVLIIVNGTMVYTLGTNGSFRGIPTIMLIAASFGLIQAFRSKSYSLKGMLKIPAIILFITAFWSWASYDGYLSTIETPLPMLNLKSVFGQAGSWLIICIQVVLGYLLWVLSGDKNHD